jgi:DNA-directed RNA polymerase subunit RPC12/RpoP
MGLLDGIEKLITEHGSAAILKERIALARDQYEALERRAAELQTENARLCAANEGLLEKARQLERELSQADAGYGSPYVCDHCGSTRLVRVGNRPDPTFGELGVKQAVFRCHECGKESSFTQHPPT